MFACGYIIIFMHYSMFCMAGPNKKENSVIWLTDTNCTNIAVESVSFKTASRP